MGFPSGLAVKELIPGEENATHFSILAWRIPWPDVPVRLQSTGLQRVGHHLVTKYTHTHFTSC